MSAGCKFCYAEAMSGRNPAVLGEWGPNGTRVVASEAQWALPARWNRWARDGVCSSCAGKSAANRATGVMNGPCPVCNDKIHIHPYRARVFCASLADVFEGPDTIPFLYCDEVSDARKRLFGVIDATPNLDWLLLTKRPQNVRRFWASARRRKNVWLGTTTEDQESFDKRLPHALDCRDLVSVVFLSVEPMLEMVDLRSGFGSNGVGWVIVGGESGSQARPFNPEWARLVRDQCMDAGVPLFVKQMGSNPIQLTVKKKGGELDDIPSDLRVREFPSIA